MRRYSREIDSTLIKSIVSEDQYKHMVEVEKQYQELLSEKRKIERELLDKLKSRVIGDLERVEMNYLSLGNTFYISYENEEREESSWLNIFRYFK